MRSFRGFRRPDSRGEFFLRCHRPYGNDLCRRALVGACRDRRLVFRERVRGQNRQGEIDRPAVKVDGAG